MELNPEGKARLRRDKLLAKGFDFSCYTSTYTTQEGSQYFYCYEQGYLPMEKGYLFAGCQERILKNNGMATLRSLGPNPRLHAVFCGGYRRGDGIARADTTLSIPLNFNSKYRKSITMLAF